MNILWIYAHPEPYSLSGSLKDTGIRAARDNGHDVRICDLYAMGWKPTVDGGDFVEHDSGERLVVTSASKQANTNGTLSDDILAEHEKLRWADALVVQFPLWWYGMPAILKGWFDRVFVKGFAYGVHDPANPGRTLRYGEGNLTGKRALVVLTAGSREPAFGPRGINGQLDQAMFGLLHGTLWYTGMDVLPPLAVYGADKLQPDEFADAQTALRKRICGLETDAPLAYRYQNHGDYDGDLVLKPEHAPGRQGLGVHLAG